MSAGYRNPPKRGQFKKGQSGNPKGRPKQTTQPVSTAYLFYKVANEQVAIEIDGNEVMMTRWVKWTPDLGPRIVEAKV